MQTLKKQNAFVDFDMLVGVVWLGIAALALFGAVTIWLAPDLRVGGMACAARMAGACMLGGAALLARSVWWQR